MHFSLLARNCLSLEPHYRPSIIEASGLLCQLGEFSRLLQKSHEHSDVDVPPTLQKFKFKGILSVEVELGGGLVVALAVGE